jgi:hypothetical protein
LEHDRGDARRARLEGDATYGHIDRLAERCPLVAERSDRVPEADVRGRH